MNNKFTNGVGINHRKERSIMITIISLVINRNPNVLMNLEDILNLGLEEEKVKKLLWKLMMILVLKVFHNLLVLILNKRLGKLLKGSHPLASQRDK